jgi:hypothetical protein
MEPIHFVSLNYTKRVYPDIFDIRAQPPGKVDGVLKGSRKFLQGYTAISENIEVAFIKTKWIASLAPAMAQCHIVPLWLLYSLIIAVRGIPRHNQFDCFILDGPKLDQASGVEGRIELDICTCSVNGLSSCTGVGGIFGWLVGLQIVSVAEISIRTVFVVWSDTFRNPRSGQVENFL